MDTGFRAKCSVPKCRGWLNCQSREAEADGQLRRGRRLIIHLVKHRNDWRYFAPQNQNEERWTRIAVGDRRVLLGIRACAIVANLQARGLEVQVICEVSNSSRVSRQYHGRMLGNFGRYGGSGMGVRFTRFQQTSVSDPRSQGKQPHQQHHQCGIAFDAGVGEDLHTDKNYRQLMLQGHRNTVLIFVKPMVHVAAFRGLMPVQTMAAILRHSLAHR